MKSRKHVSHSPMVDKTTHLVRIYVASFPGSPLVRATGKPGNEATYISLNISHATLFDDLILSH